MSVDIREDPRAVHADQPPFLERLFPEVSASGFTRMDGTVEFYTRVNALLRPDMTVLDFGAGRGAGLVDATSDCRRLLHNLKGKVTKVIGVDVYPVVTTNPGLDEAHVIEPGANLPLADASVDMIVADFVFEHIADPERLASMAGNAREAHQHDYTRDLALPSWREVLAPMPAAATVPARARAAA